VIPEERVEAERGCAGRGIGELGHGSGLCSRKAVDMDGWEAGGTGVTWWVGMYTRVFHHPHFVFAFQVADITTSTIYIFMSRRSHPGN
jgi:hypothetical protein